ncbi:MAG: NAD(+) diphosphatase [Lachnospiraceae bacterium]|nr:NAD(+) diphosphatase [Lachnospiraceae bacterium]
MIQDIFPSKLDNSFKKCDMKDGDNLFIFDKSGKILVRINEGSIDFPRACEAGGKETIYLFSLDDKRFFLQVETSDTVIEGFSFLSVRDIRDNYSGKEIFAVFTAYHLNKWYADNCFCGRCSAKLTFGEKERSLVCPDCKNTIYPRINPAVIVGVKNKNKLLITRYKNGYAHNALVAGFTEIGETLEETVSREVMEEAGVKVKNIRYYKSQPWGMAQDILMGFYCEVDGDDTIRMDENELKYAKWVEREEIVLQPNNLSLTNEMMRMFKEGKEI